MGGTRVRLGGGPLDGEDILIDDLQKVVGIGFIRVIGIENPDVMLWVYSHYR